MFASCIIWPVCSNFMPTLTANLFEMQFSFFLRLQWSSIQRQNRILRFRKKSKRKQNCQSVHFSKQVALGCDFKSFANKICLVETVPQFYTHIDRKLVWNAIWIFFRITMILRNILKTNHLIQTIFWVGPADKFSFSFALFFTQITSLTQFFKLGPKRVTRIQIFLLRIIFYTNHLTHTIFWVGPKARDP